MASLLPKGLIIVIRRLCCVKIWFKVQRKVRLNFPDLVISRVDNEGVKGFTNKPPGTLKTIF